MLANDARSPFIVANFRANGSNFEHVVMLDTGASISTFPICRLPQAVIRAIQPTSCRLSGIGGSASLAGEITATIHLGDRSTPPIKNAKFLVTHSNTPVLIGQNILKDPTIKYWYEDTQNNCVSFHRVGVPQLRHETAVLSKEHLEREFNGHINLTTFKQKSEWLKKTKKVNLPGTFKKNELEALTDVLIKHSDVLGNETDPGTFIRSVALPTNGQSKSVGQFPIAEALRERFDAEIHKMEREGIIEPCSDPKGFNSPAFPVLKKNGNVRVVVNFKPTLNQVLINLDPWPLPTIDSLMASVGTGNRYFASMDLRSGYFQIPINENDRHKTAFMHQGRCMQFTRLAMGITSAGNIFCRAVGEALATIPNKQNLCTYSDDNLVFAKDFKTFIQALESFLVALKEFGLRVNPEKCNFMSRSAEFLGRIVSSEGIGPNKEYVQGIRDMPAPTTKKECMSLIGRLVWIRQFIETRLNEQIRLNTFAQLMAPIHETIKEGRTFKWTHSANKSFNKIKVRLSSTPIISFADYALPFTLTTDASEKAAGAVLMQETRSGKKRIIGVASTKFSKTEQNWSATEREAYAIKWSIKKFDYFLRGRPFVLFTDHKSLVYLDQKHFNNSKISRWQDELGQYKFQVQYLEGESNVFADMLSRPAGLKSLKQPDNPEPAGKFYTIPETGLQIYIPSWASDKLSGDPIAIEPLKYDPKQNIARAYFNESAGQNVRARNRLILADQQLQDPYLKAIIEYLQGNSKIKTGALFPKEDQRSRIYSKLLQKFHLHEGTDVLSVRINENSLMVIPYELRKLYLEQAHDKCNHQGISRVTDTLKPYWWEEKQNDIKNYVKSCLSCAKRKGRYGQKPDWNIGHCKRGTKPFEVVFTDFVHMPRSKGKAYILTILCSYSRYLITVPTAHDRAIDAARGLYQLFLQHRTIPEIVSSDRGTHFTGAVYRDFCAQMGIKQELHCPWRPQSSGNIERQHRTLKNALFILTNERKCEWTDVLQSVTSNMNASINKTIGASPHYVLTGQKPNMGLPSFKSEINVTPKTYGNNIRNLLQAVKQSVTIANREADYHMDKRLENSICRELLEPGDQILIYRPQSSEAKRTKMDWIGPATIVATNDMVIKVRENDGNTSWVHRSHIRKLISRKENLLSNLPPPPEPQPYAEDFSKPDPPTSRGDSRPSNPVSNQPSPVFERPRRVPRPPKRLIETINPYRKTYEDFIYPPPPVDDELDEPEFNETIVAGNLGYSSDESAQLSEFQTCIEEATKTLPESNLTTPLASPITDYSNDSLDTSQESEHLETEDHADDPENSNKSIIPVDQSNEPDTEASVSEQIISEESSSSTLTCDGKCSNPIPNEFVKLTDTVFNTPADELLSDSLKEAALKESIHYFERCLFDISDKATLLRVVEEYKLDTKHFKNPLKKLDELRNAVLEKIPNTPQNLHKHGLEIWPVVAIPTKYTRNSAKAEKTKMEISNPSTGTKSKVKMFDIQNLTYFQLLWLHVQYKIPLQRRHLSNCSSLITNLESHSHALEISQ